MWPLDEFMKNEASENLEKKDTPKLVNEIPKIESYPAITRSLIGCIKGADKELEDYIDYLAAKHSSEKERSD